MAGRGISRVAIINLCVDDECTALTLRTENSDQTTSHELATHKSIVSISKRSTV